MIINKIIATFKDGRQVLYTYNILNLLLSDNDVIMITDAATGEILKGGLS